MERKMPVRVIIEFNGDVDGKNTHIPKVTLEAGSEALPYKSPKDEEGSGEYYVELDVDGRPYRAYIDAGNLDRIEKPPTGVDGVTHHLDDCGEGMYFVVGDDRYMVECVRGGYRVFVHSAQKEVFHN